MQLNKAQQKAVQHKSGPMLVIAGAGTGKTRVIIERIKELTDCGVEQSNIVALTFTEKAASEMEERLVDSLGQYLIDVNISTYNSYGESILRRFGSEIGLSSSLTLLNEKSMAIFMRQNLDEYKLDYYKPIGDPASFVIELLSYFGKLKQKNITSEKYSEYVSNLPKSTQEEKLDYQRELELSTCYEKHIEICKKAGVIDYDDQIFLTIELLNRRPNLLSRVRKKIEYILVDEYQDTNNMQAELVMLLAGKDKNIMAVGDDDQAIYGFRGADISNILDFKTDFPDSKEIVLTENYRSSTQILDSAYRLIQNNNPDRLETSLNINKKLTSSVKGRDIVFEKFNNHTDELSWIGESISNQIKNGVKPEEIAILVRKNALGKNLQATLSYYNIQSYIAGQTHNLFDEPIIKAVADTTRLLTNFNDNQLLYNVISGYIFNYYDIELTTQSDSSQRRHESLWSNLQNSKDKELAKILDTISKLREESSKIDVLQTIYNIIEYTGLKDDLFKAAETDYDKSREVMHISQLFDLVKDYLSTAEDKSLSNFVNNLTLLSELSEGSSDDIDFGTESGVSIMTIHKSKGLEWDTVYIPSLYQGFFPGVNRSGGIKLPEIFEEEVTRSKFIQEERRLMYVAMTRAKSNLILTVSENYGQVRPKKPSMFIAEALTSDSPVLSSHESSLELKIPKKINITKSKVLPSKFIDNSWLVLSVSQINDFRRCPLDFYYRHILSVPSTDSTSPAIGTAVHRILELYNLDKLEGQVKMVPDYVQQLQELWPKEGFMSIKEREESLARASSAVQNYLEKHESVLAPKYIEKGFEVYFNDSNIKIKGRFDAVSVLDDKIEIIDYKTSTINKTEESLKKSASRSDQLTLYALIWEQMTGEKPDMLTLDYVLTGKKATISKQQRAIDNFRNSLVEVAEKIRNLEFEEGSSHLYCRHS